MLNFKNALSQAEKQLSEIKFYKEESESLSNKFKDLTQEFQKTLVLYQKEKEKVNKFEVN